MVNLNVMVIQNNLEPLCVIQNHLEPLCVMLCVMVIVMILVMLMYVKLLFCTVNLLDRLSRSSRVLDNPNFKCYLIR
jgi:hypothetical protein